MIIRRHVPRWLRTGSATLLLLVAILLTQTRPAYGDHCGGLSDCFGTIAAAALVIAALAVLAAVAIIALPEIVGALGADLATTELGATIAEDLTEAEVAETAVEEAEAAQAVEADAAAAEGEPVAGETEATRIGKQVHKEMADIRRASGEYDAVNSPITDQNGNPIDVAKSYDLRSGEPKPGSPLQTANPDALNYGERLIIDDKPLGRPIMKDRQEIIRFCKAFQEREGVLPKVIEIYRYDPATGMPAGVETYTPGDFLSIWT